MKSQLRRYRPTATELRQLSDRWTARWPGVEPISYDLRRSAKQTWVRFHSLPGSKRHASNEEEYRILLERHRTLLTELGAEGELYLIAAGTWIAGGKVQLPKQDNHPGARLWRTLAPSDSTAFCVPIRLYIDKVPALSGWLGPFLRAVADEKLTYAIIVPTNVAWLYHPYDGGGDVIAPSVEIRDRLVAAHRDWLSSYPSGL